MPFGIRPSNVCVCHSTTRAWCVSIKLSADDNRLQVALLVSLMRVLIVIKRNESIMSSNLRA